MTHVNTEEIEKVKMLIEVLLMRQSLLSETTLVSEDALCPICYAYPNGKNFSSLLITIAYSIFLQIPPLNRVSINHVIRASFNI